MRDALYNRNNKMIYKYCYKLFQFNMVHTHIKITPHKNTNQKYIFSYRAPSKNYLATPQTPNTIVRPFIFISLFSPLSQSITIHNIHYAPFYNILPRHGHPINTQPRKQIQNNERRKEMHLYYKTISIKICINNLVFTICYICYQQPTCTHHALFRLVITIIALLCRLML